MKHRVLQDLPGEVVFAFSGFGAWSILKAESGIHIWEIQKTSKKKDRIRAYVEVVPQEMLSREDDWYQSASRLLKAAEQARKLIVRTYRAEPSPLVKDNTHGWRTGLIHRVLEGDFDLFD